jgi:hypothetical protein
MQGNAPITINGAGNIFAGVRRSGSASITINGAALASYVLTAAGAAAITIGAAGAMYGARRGIGQSSITISVGVAPTRAKGVLRGNGNIQMGGGLQPYAIGNMVGSTLYAPELTPQNVAEAVWTRGIEAGYTAEEIIRLLAAYAAGDATGLDSSAIFIGLDGATQRILGTISGATRNVTGLDASP